MSFLFRNFELPTADQVDRWAEVNISPTDKAEEFIFEGRIMSARREDGAIYGHDMPTVVKSSSGTIPAHEEERIHAELAGSNSVRYTNTARQPSVA